MFDQFALLKSIKSINISNNKITSHGFRILLKGLQTIPFEQINLDNNMIDEKGLDFIISIKKHNPNLKLVTMKNNPVDLQNRETLK